MKDYCVLVVDDDRTIHKLLEKILSRIGLERVDCVDTGLAAIEYLLDNHPDLVLLDIQLPDMDGWTLCEMIQKMDRWKDIPVIFQSALIGGDNIRRGIDLGAHSYLEKPYTKDKVESVVCSALEPNTPAIKGPSTEMQLVVRVVSESVKHTFNLMLGTQTQIIKTEQCDPTNLGNLWDFTGFINAHGLTEISLSTGWDRRFAVNASSALTQLDEEELDDELIQDSLQEILNMVMGTAIRTIGKTFPVQLEVPNGGMDQAIPYPKAAAFHFNVQVKTEAYLFPLLVSINPKEKH